MMIGAIIAARMTSERLPGKHLLPFGGRPAMLGAVLERAARIPRLDTVVLAIPAGAEHDALAHHAANHRGVQVWRGSEDDVLERYAEAAWQFRLDVVVRITADCPLFDPFLVGRLLRGFALASDRLFEVTAGAWLDGLDAEVFPAAMLFMAEHAATTAEQREHVTPWMKANQPSVQLQPTIAERQLLKLVAKGWEKWSVDTAEDIQRVSAIASKLPPGVWPWPATVAAANVAALAAAHEPV